MSVEQIEQLGLQRGARTVRVEVGEEWILRLLEHDSRVETRAEPLGQRRFAGADRTFDRDVAEVQGAPMISSRRDANTRRADARGQCVRVRAAGAGAASHACLPAAPPSHLRGEEVVDSSARGSARSPRRRAPRRGAARLPRRRGASGAPRGAAASGSPDLLRLLTDGDARIRRRAALAVGRVGLRDGVPPLITLLADGEPEVRQMAAFALGLIGDASARDPLVAALTDPSPLVQGQRRGGARPDRRCVGC